VPEPYVRYPRPPLVPGGHYPPAQVWLKLEKEIEQITECEPKLVRANPGGWPELWLPADWPEEKRSAWVERWEAKA
jgi:hypothetical protein